MRQLLSLLTVSCLLLLIFNLPVFSQARYSTCDLCGFCPPNPPPTSWENCRRCLYEGASANPNDRETILINDETNLPPTPIPGRWYTIIGCVNSNLSSFQSQGAVGSVVQMLLNIVFSAAGALSLAYIIYGSFLVLTSQADPERLNYGRRVLYAAIIGLIFSLSSVFIVNLIGAGILKIPGFGGS